MSWAIVVPGNGRVDSGGSYLLTDRCRRCLDVAADSFQFYLGDAVVGDVHLLEPRHQRLCPRAFPIAEDLAFGQVGKAFVAFDLRILLGGDGDLAELLP